MPRKLANKKPVGRHHGRQLSPAKVEAIIQTYAVTNNVRDTANRHHITEKTAHKYIKLAVPSEVLAARQKAIRELAGKTHITALNIIESISPEDLVSGRIPIRGTGNEIVGYRHYGPTLMQKVTSAAILTDKLEVLQNIEAALKDGQAQGELILPGDVKTLVQGIRSQVKRLTILDIQFNDKNKDLSKRVQEKLEEVEALADVQPAEYEELNFDNPGGIEDAETSKVPNTVSS